MYVVGIDLSGPANAADTAIVGFRLKGHRLVLSEDLSDVDDHSILQRFRQWTAEEDVIAGIDAPLSYNVGGGDRPGDARLRRAIINVGLHPGTVMAPTLNRMVYLTLRGITVSRMLQSLGPQKPSIVEVHPSATIALRGGPVEHVLVFRAQADARHALLNWLEGQGLEGVATSRVPSSHYVAACACALAAWKWSIDQPVWVESAIPPVHPFDFAC